MDLLNYFGVNRNSYAPLKENNHILKNFITFIN